MFFDFYQTRGSVEKKGDVHLKLIMIMKIIPTSKLAKKERWTGKKGRIETSQATFVEVLKYLSISILL